MKRSKKIAIAAIMSALSVVLLLLGSYLQVMDMSAAAIASFIVMLSVIELGGGYPYLIWAVTGILSFLLVPDKFGAVLYIVFAGIYPIFKAMFERIHYIVSWVLKLSFFNTALTAFVILTRYLLALPDSVGFTVIVYGLGNLVFVLYDITATQFITLYLVKLRKRLGLGNYFK